jgi:hypothetical protein
MTLSGRTTERRNGERGISLFFVAGFMFVLLGIGALAIDLASMYVARNEAQRAADSAALAGAKVFVESGCITSGTCVWEQTDATARAIQVGGQNLLVGQAAAIQASDVSFDLSSAQNPRITVQVNSGTLNTFFASAFGIATTNGVSASATAEAYNPSGATGGPTFCTGCLRPWILPNCDLIHGSPQNLLCAGSQGYLLDPNNNYSVAHPDCVISGGVIGETLAINLESQPAQFGAVDDGTGTLGYQQSINTCNTGQMTCGATVNTLPGSKMNFTTAGVDSLLHLPGNTTGLNQGQDWINTSVCPPRIHGGARNPLVSQGVVPQDDLISTSDSIVTAYIFDGSALTPGISQPVTIRGFAQIFVTQVDDLGNVWGVILGLAGCGNTSGSCGAGSGVMKGPTMLPVRLIRQS